MQSTLDKIVLPSKQKRRHHQAYIPIEQLIYYADKGLSHVEIAALHNITRQAVQARLSKAGYTPQRLKAYKDSRADMLAFYQSLLLNSIAPADIKKAPLQARVMAYGILYDKERLERGQSTSNIAAITSIVQAVHERKPQQVVVPAPEQVSVDRSVAEMPAIEGQTPAPSPEIEGGRGELNADNVTLPPHDPPVE